MRQGPTRAKFLTVDRDPEQVTELLEFAAGQFQRTKIPQHEMAVGSIRLELVALCDQLISQRAGVGNNLFGIGLPGGLASL